MILGRDNIIYIDCLPSESESESESESNSEGDLGPALDDSSQATVAVAPATADAVDAAPATSSPKRVFDIPKWHMIVDNRADICGGNGTKKQLKESLAALRRGVTGGLKLGTYPARFFADRLATTIKTMKKSHWRKLKSQSLLTLLRAHKVNEAWHAKMRAGERASGITPITYSSAGGTFIEEISAALIKRC